MGPIRPMLRDAEVTEQQWRVLRVLDNAGPMEPTTLSEAALLYPPSVARIVRDLVERRLVIRSAHPTDKRRAVLSISPSGAALMKRTSAQTIAKLNDYTTQFGQERLAHLIAELQALTLAIGPSDPGVADRESEP